MAPGTCWHFRLASQSHGTWAAHPAPAQHVHRVQLAGPGMLGSSVSLTRKLTVFVSDFFSLSLPQSPKSVTVTLTA